MRLGVDEKGITELVGVTEMISALNKVASGLLLDDEADDPPPLLAYPADDELEDRARDALGAIEEVEGSRLGRSGIPKFWRLLARNGRYFAATWEKYHLLLDRGDLETQAKTAVALGASVTNASRYFIRYFYDALIHAGWDDGRVLEIFGVVDQYNSFNTLATGMQIESDIRPESDPR